MSKTITRENLQQLWKKAKFYTDEKLVAIPDRTGYWNGSNLTFDNLENGMYTVKFVSESGIVESERELAVGANRTFALTLPASTAYMEVFNSAGEKMGRIRTDVPVAAGGAGEQGADGKSAYEIWLAEGNSGTESEFLASLKGEKGEKGEQGDKGDKGEKGDAGEKGADGYTPVRGVDYATEEDVLAIAQVVLASLPQAEGVSF